MIRIRRDERGRNCPVIQCDRCGAVLEDGKGLCFLRKSGEIEFYCKGSCDPGHPPDFAGWMDIGVFIAYLITNTNTDIKKSKDMAEGMSC